MLYLVYVMYKTNDMSIISALFKTNNVKPVYMYKTMNKVPIISAQFNWKCCTHNNSVKMYISYSRCHNSILKNSVYFYYVSVGIEV